MNAAGLTFVLGGVSSVLGMTFFDTLVSNGSIAQEELDGTRADIASIITTLKATPGSEIEAMVDKYNSELSAHLNSFNSEWPSNYLAAFRDSQVMLGYTSSVMAESGLSD